VLVADLGSDSWIRLSALDQFERSFKRPMPFYCEGAAESSADVKVERRAAAKTYPVM
jgi:hypothetical protein